MLVVPQTLKILSFLVVFGRFGFACHYYNTAICHFLIVEVTYLRLYGGLKATVVIQPCYITLKKTKTVSEALAGLW